MNFKTNLSKPSQIRRHRAKTNLVKAGKEGEFQSHANEALDNMCVHYWRVPDTMDGKRIKAALCGMADNLIQIPIGHNYCLCLNMELKTEVGILHGKQKRLSKELNYQVVRSMDEVIDAVLKMQKTAIKLSQLMDREENEIKERICIKRS